MQSEFAGVSYMGGYIKWICFRSDWYIINLELHNVSITVIKVLWQTWHYNFNWLHMFLFIIPECSHEVVLPLDSDGKNGFQKCFKLVWKEKSIVMVCQRWIYGILFILQRILRELQLFCFFFFSFHFPECSSYCSSSFWDCPEETLACHDISATESQQSHWQAAVGLGEPSEAVLSVTSIRPLQAGREESHYRQDEGHEKRWNRWETSKGDLLKLLETNRQIWTKSEPWINIPTLIWKPCSYVPHINMVCPIKKVLSSFHSL